MDLKFIEIPKITNDEVFENLIKDIYENNKDFTNANLNGRSGQSQNGVDVFARNKNDLSWLGAQCKVRSSNISFTKKEIKKEIDSALKFNPKLTKFILYTSLSRDSKTQIIERELADDLTKRKGFDFEIKFWDDITEILKKEENKIIYYRYFNSFFRDNKSLGHSVGKLVNLELAFNNVPDSHYELMIGQIPNYKNDKGVRVDYYRGVYFVADLLNKTIEFFRVSKDNKASCFPTDLMDAIKNQIDCYRISKWISSIENMNDFIYNGVHDYKFSITDEERHQYFDERES